LQLFKKILFFAITIAIGCLFIFSAISKLKDIEPFEWTIAETGLINYTWANILARVVIGLEFSLGFLFIINSNFKNYTYRIAAWLLILFNIYLLYILFTYGNSNNCGCFGKDIYFTPLQAYLKNMAILVLIYILSKIDFKMHMPNKVILIAALILGTLGTCLKEPPEFIYIKDKQEVNPYAINLDPLYSDSASSKPDFNYKTDKKIICVFSTYCIFCKKAARRIHTMQVHNNKLPFYFILGADSTQLKGFLDETQAYHIPMQLNKDHAFLSKISGEGLPAILWIDKGKVVRKSNYYNIDEKEMNIWANDK
jgi:uncharacterized membrane protein YphA (DoxX/SURF4 family)